MQKAVLRLFNAVQVDEQVKNSGLDQAILERTVQNGYILDPAVPPSEAVLDAIEQVVGISGEKANTAFHKSWSVIQNSSMEQLVVQQAIHYLTTYGFEAAGFYSRDAVYIPQEELKLPALQKDLPLLMIRAMDAQELLDRIVKLGETGIALAQETLDDIMVIVKKNNYDSSFVHEIGNRELKALLYDFYGLVPSEPVEFLRHLISKLTNESLLIKNDGLINTIKQANGKFLDMLLRDAPDDLASIFFRFKPLFLALKSISDNKTFFNRLRKQATRLHKPMPEDYLNSVTAQIKQDRLDLTVLEKKLQRASVFRKIRLAYALKFRESPCSEAVVYRVRNGRGWVAPFQWPKHAERMTKQALEIVLCSLADDLHPTLEGKLVYIPANIHYALPATEKQFTGHLPTGSFIAVPKDLIVGIHWVNNEKRVDLDLSVIGESGKIGWDASYRSWGKRILFSGDMTDAPPPHGASELFYIKKGGQEARILLANYYNFKKGDQVECKILVAQERAKKFEENYMVDPNNILGTANITIIQKQNVLGLITPVAGENRVYFANISIGNSITSVNNDCSRNARKFLLKKMVDSLDLREVLSRAGALVVDQMPEDECINLSPEALDKTTIIDLLTTDKKDTDGVSL